MNLEFLNTATAKELEQFKAVCNQLLSRTYVVRTLYRPGRGRVSNPDYTFLSIHYESVREYLSLLDWDLRRDDINGYFYVLNTDEANRCILSKRETAILLALRMLCRRILEKLGHTIAITSEVGVGTTVRIGLEQDALCSVREVLEKIVTDYAILPAKPNMEEVKRALTVFENHSILQRIEGKFNQADCRFAILPTIQTAVSSERLNEVAAVLRKEETADEETEEDSAD